MNDGRNLAKDPAVWGLVLGIIAFLIVFLLIDEDRFLYAGGVAIVAAGIGYFGARVLFGGGYISDENQEPPAPPAS